MIVDPRVVGAFVAMGFYGLWYLSQPGRSATTMVQELQQLLLGTTQLTEKQRAMVDIIESEANRAGFGWLGVAATVNAYAESRLDPVAAGDGGLSIGLFQLHARGAGTGMTVEERQDPSTNARRIFEVVAGPQGAAVRAARGRANNEALTELFAHHIERCWECGHQGGSAQLVARRALVTTLFGAGVARQVPG